MYPGFCLLLSEHCHFHCAGIDGGLKNSYYFHLIFLSVVVRAQIWEFRIALDKIDQAVHLTTVVSKVLHGFSSKVFWSVSQRLGTNSMLYFLWSFRFDHISISVFSLLIVLQWSFLLIKILTRVEGVVKIPDLANFTGK